MNISNLIRRFRSYVPKRFHHSAFARSFFAFYQSLILLGLAHGVYKGIESFVLWRKGREEIRLTHKILEPIINASVDAGYLGYYVFWTGILSGLIVATAPVSIPIIIQTMRQKQIHKQELQELQEMKAKEAPTPK